jgi:hypothetical protein
MNTRLMSINQSGEDLYSMYNGQRSCPCAVLVSPQRKSSNVQENLYYIGSGLGISSLG